MANPSHSANRYFFTTKKNPNSFYLGLIRSTKETLFQQDVSAEGSSIIQRPGWEKSKQPALQSTNVPHEAALISPMFRDNIMRLLTPPLFFFQTACAKTHSSGHQVFVRWQKEKGRTTPKLVTAAPARCPSRRPWSRLVYFPIAKKNGRSNKASVFLVASKNWVCWRVGRKQRVKCFPQLWCPGWQTWFWYRTLKKVLEGREENWCRVRRQGNGAWK